MDADHLLKAQSEAVTAACACLAAAYEAPHQSGPRPWLDAVALAFLHFARGRCLIDPPAGAWLGIRNGESSTPEDALAAEVGLLCLSIAGNFDRQSDRRARRSIRGTLDIVNDVPPPPASVAPPPEADPLGSGERTVVASPDLRGLLAAPLHCRGERIGLLLGGLLVDDGSVNPVADDDPLLASLFAAISHAASARIMESHVHRRDLLARFTPVQRRVLSLLGDGLTEREIAQRTETSTNTVHDHVSTIYRTLNVHSRLELIELWHGRRAPTLPTPVLTRAAPTVRPTPPANPPRR